MKYKELDEEKLNDLEQKSKDLIVPLFFRGIILSIITYFALKMAINGYDMFSKIVISIFFLIFALNAINDILAFLESITIVKIVNSIKQKNDENLEVYCSIDNAIKKINTFLTIIFILVPHSAIAIMAIISMKVSINSWDNSGYYLFFVYLMVLLITMFSAWKFLSFVLKKSANKSVQKNSKNI